MWLVEQQKFEYHKLLATQECDFGLTSTLIMYLTVIKRKLTNGEYTTNNWTTNSGRPNN